MDKKIFLIAAMSENYVIGLNNRLPWNLPADWDHFRKITRGKPFIMGRNSYLSEDVLLSDYKTVILSHQKDLDTSRNCLIATGIDEALDLLGDEPDIFVLGGENVFRQFLPIARYIYLTIVHIRIKGDAFFPQIDPLSWEEIGRIYNSRDKNNFYDYTFVEYRRKSGG